MPRKLINKHGGVNGLFPSLVMPGKQVAYLGTLQRDLCYVLEYANDVKSYTANPFKVHTVRDDGTRFVHIPDFQAVHQEGMLLIECLYDDQLNEPTTLMHRAIGKAWAHQHDHIYAEVIANRLRAGHYLNNLKLLWRYAHTHVPPSLTIECRDILAEQEQGLTFRSLTEHLAARCGNELGKELYPRTVPPCLCHLLFVHVLGTDLAQPISDDSLIWLRASSKYESSEWLRNQTSLLPLAWKCD